MAFLHFKKCIPPPDAVDDALRCISLRWAAAEGEANETEVDRLERENYRIAAGKWFAVLSVESVLNTLHAVRANNAVHPFTTELPWNRPASYINEFFRESDMRTERMHC